MDVRAYQRACVLDSTFIPDDLPIANRDAFIPPQGRMCEWCKVVHLGDDREVVLVHAVEFLERGFKIGELDRILVTSILSQQMIEWKCLSPTDECVQDYLNVKVSFSGFFYRRSDGDYEASIMVLDNGQVCCIRLDSPFTFLRRPFPWGRKNTFRDRQHFQTGVLKVAKRTEADGTDTFILLFFSYEVRYLFTIFFLKGFDEPSSIASITESLTHRNQTRHLFAFIHSISIHRCWDVDGDSEVFELLQLPIVYIGKLAFNRALYDDPKNLNHSSSHVFVIDDVPQFADVEFRLWMEKKHFHNKVEEVEVRRVRHLAAGPATEATQERDAEFTAEYF